MFFRAANGRFFNDTQVQWQPTLDFHDPNPPLPLEDGLPPSGFEPAPPANRTARQLQIFDPGGLASRPATLHPGGFETATAPNRAQAGPPRHLAGDPLPLAAIQTLPGGFDSAATGARQAGQKVAPSVDAVPPIVFRATSYEHAEPSARPQAGPPRHVVGEPLPEGEFLPAGFVADWAPGRATLRPTAVPGGDPIPPRVFPPTSFEHAEPSSRPQVGPPRHVSGEPVPPEVFPPAGYEHSEPNARPQTGPPRHISGEPLPPRVFPATGFEHADPSSRPQPGPPRHLPGEPLPSPEFLPSGYDLAWSPGRPVARPVQAPGGDPEPPRVYTATGYETATGPRRPDLGPPRHLAGEATPPVVEPPTGFEHAEPSQRLVPRYAQPAGGEPNPPVFFPPTSYETATAPRRADPGPARHLPADAMPRVAGAVIGTLADSSPAAARAPARPQSATTDPIAARDVIGGAESATVAQRSAARSQPISGDVLPPRVFTGTGFEHIEPSARVRPGPPRHSSGEPVPPRMVRGAGIDGAPASARAPGRPQPGGSDPAVGRAPAVGVFDPPAPRRSPPRTAPASGDVVPADIFSPTGFEATPAGSRPQAGPPKHLDGEPAPARLEQVAIVAAPALSRAIRAPDQPGGSASVGSAQVGVPDVSPPRARAADKVPAGVAADPSAGVAPVHGFDPAVALARPAISAPPVSGEPTRPPSVLLQPFVDNAVPMARSYLPQRGWSIEALARLAQIIRPLPSWAYARPDDSERLADPAGESTTVALATGDGTTDADAGDATTAAELAGVGRTIAEPLVPSDTVAVKIVGA